MTASFSSGSFSPFALSPIAFAIAGLIEEIEQGLWPPKQDSAGSRAKKGKRAERRGIPRRQLLDEDDAILLAIMSAVTEGALST